MIEFRRGLMNASIDKKTLLNIDLKMSLNKTCKVR